MATPTVEDGVLLWLCAFSSKKGKGCSLSSSERRIIADYESDPCAISLGSFASVCKKLTDSRTRSHGAFFGYVNLTHFDLSKYGIYSSEAGVKCGQHSLLTALKAAKFPEDGLVRLRCMFESREIPEIKLKTLICEEFKCRIRLSTSNKTTIYGGRGETYNIALVDDHYFVNDEAPATIFAVKHYDEVKDLPDCHRIISKVGNAWNRTKTFPKAKIFVQKLIESKHVRPMEGGRQHRPPPIEPDVERRIRDTALWSYTLSSLHDACRCLGISHDLRFTRGLLIYQILRADAPPRMHNSSPWIPDESQVEALGCHQRAAHLLLHGGPGSGKTEVLLQMVSNSPPETRVLLLLYTNCNERMALVRLRSGRTRNVYTAGQLRKHEGGPGVFVSTLDKYADKRLPPLNAAFADYSTRFQEGLDAGKQQWERWDCIFVDECQDLTCEHEKLIASIGAPKSVRAGDPRQELYEGSGAFSRLCLEGNGYARSQLRYNHRSSRRVVDVLNAFSKFHFGELHVPQIATRSFEGSVDCFTHRESAELSRATASRVAEGDFVISPVSLDKYWGTSQLVTGIRQSIVDLSASRLFGLVLAEKQNDTLTRGTVTIGNSFRLKGLECTNAVLVQGDIPYETLNISRKTLARLLFVALSRCRDTLSIALSRPIREEGALACVAELLQQKTEVLLPRSPKLPRQVVVRNDLCNAPLACHVLEQWGVSPLNVTDARAPDFVGLLVEGRVASVMGVPCCSEWQVRENESGDSDEMYIDGDTCHVCCRKALLPIVDELVGDAGADVELTFAQISYTLVAGMKWTLGTNHNFDATPAAALGSACLRAVRRRLPLYAHRSRCIVGEVHGVTDIESEDAVIEVKHTGKNADIAREQRQVMIYAALANKQCYLYKSLVGFVQRLEPVSTAFVLNLARAQLGSKQAQARRRVIEPNCTKEPWKRILMTVDVETNPFSGKVIEVGAVVVDSQNGTVLDVFHYLDPAVTCLQEECPTASGLEPAFYGFDAYDTEALAPEMSRRMFRAWSERWSVADKVGFAGRDAFALGLSEQEEWRDARRLFLGWLDKNNSGRKGASRLQDAVAQLFGEDELFVPHRAFEDAVATAMISLVLYPRAALE